MIAALERTKKDFQPSDWPRRGRGGRVIQLGLHREAGGSGFWRCCDCDIVVFFFNDPTLIPNSLSPIPRGAVLKRATRHVFVRNSWRFGSARVCHFAL